MGLTHSQNFLFDPGAIAEHLSSLPYLRSVLENDPDVSQSSGFKLARKSPRQIYGMLANAHFQHLADLLKTLDFCLGRGFSQPTIVRTRASRPFAASLAELYAAEYFLLKGFAVEGTDGTKGQESVPDMIVKGHGIKLAVEVYCPRIWDGISNLSDGIRDALMNLDMAYDYQFKIRLQGDRTGTKNPMPIPHPWELSDFLTPALCEDIIRASCDAFSSNLSSPTVKIELNWPGPDLNLKMSLSARGIKVSSGNFPQRSGIINGLTQSGHAPEGIFDRLLDKYVRSKARKKQAVGHSSLSALVVDLSHYSLRSELAHSYYRGKFQESIQKHFGSTLEGHDMIAFCDKPAWHSSLQLHFLAYDKDRVSSEAIRNVGGQLESDAGTKQTSR